jgi:hypothetical protein
LIRNFVDHYDSRQYWHPGQQDIFPSNSYQRSGNYHVYGESN